MTKTERALLEDCEARIQRGRQTFVAVGLALAQIRDGKLHRDRYKTFEDYVRQRWDFGHDYAYRLISAAGVVEELQQSPELKPLLTNVNKTVLPACEAHARRLLAIKPEDRPKAWKRAVELAGGQDVSGKILNKALKPFNNQRARTKPKQAQAGSKEPLPSWRQWFEDRGKEVLAYISGHPEEAAEIEAHLQALLKKVQKARAALPAAKGPCNE